MGAAAQAERHLRLLYLEDSAADAELVGRALTAGGYVIEMDVVAEGARFAELLAGARYDVVLADYNLPAFSARAALRLTMAMRSPTPLIVVSGAIGEEETVELLKEGAVDCVLKDRLARLPFAVQRAIDDRVRQREQREAEARLTAAALEWRQTFDAMADSVALFDEDGRVVRCNSATVRLVGRDYEQIVGQPCFEVFHGAETWWPGCPQREARRTLHGETHIFEQDGRWLRVTFEPRLDPEGGFAGGVHIVSEVTGLKLTEQELQNSVDHLRSLVEQVIAAIAGIVEARDPYTSGHERRVSQLATAIAERMKLDEEVVAGVRVAALLHDVGKITVPSEILTKPGLLSEVEFALIKTHSQASWDVLHGIEFRWPVAEVALQHHERLDGSGYPQGLDGRRIIAEARILAVADVVEAMASHRPYREALGVDLALAEIKKDRGKLYDPDVVDACVALFRKNGFSFD